MTVVVDNEKPVNIRSADDLIVQEEAIKLGRSVPEVPVEVKEEPVKEEVKEEPQNDEAEQPEAATLETETEDEDEYGTPIEKEEKLYTRDEVNKMIRDRLKRGNAEQSSTVKEAAKDFKPDPDSEESWQDQLNQFIDQRIETRTKEENDRQWRAEQERIQADFEMRFTEGATKYKDFSEVVSKVPVTEAMMIAARDMKDPAAFIYAACKNQRAEIERIAAIKNPYSQMTEIGRLEERMKKARKLTSAPKPISRSSGDVFDDGAPVRQPIESLIAQHAKSKVR